MNLILSIFEQLSGLKIKFYKNEFFCLEKQIDMEQEYKLFLGCETKSLPFRYLTYPS
jgi:hypothetical protein